MVRRIDPAFKNFLSQPSLTVAFCWLITRRIDGLQLGFTSLDMPFTIDGVEYRPFTGFDPGASQSSSDLGKVDSQQLKGILDESGIDRDELLAGMYEYASVERFLINYEDIPSSLSLVPPKHLSLPHSHFAESKRNSLGFEIKVKDDLSLLGSEIVDTTSKVCRNDLGDDRCRKDLASFTYNLTVVSTTDRRIFEVDGNLPDKWLDGGRLQFSSGLNQGIYRDIGYFVNKRIILAPSSAPFDVSIGDSVTAIAGCAKTKLICITKFQNFHNFNGEPDLPTTDLATDTPSR